MPALKTRSSLTFQEVQPLYEALVDELQREIFNPHYSGVIKLPTEWQIAVGSISLSDMERVNTIFRKHNLSYLLSMGGADGRTYPVFRITCFQNKETEMNYQEWPKK